MKSLTDIFKKIATLVLAVFMFLNFSLVSQASIQDSTDYFAQGLKAHESEDYENALKFYNKYLKKFPNDAPTYNNRGNVLVEMGEDEKGMQDYLMALSIDSSIQLVRYNIGKAKFDQGLFGESVEYYKQEIKVNSAYSSAYNNLGYAYYMLEAFDLAINSYKKALDLDTNFTLAQINLENAREQKAINKKWKDKRAKYNMIVYDSLFNELKELGFPSAYNRHFVFSSHYIYENWNTYSGVALKLYERNNKLVHVINLKDGVENGYAVDFDFYKDLGSLTYTCQDEKYKIEISYTYSFEQRKKVPYSVRIEKITNKEYYTIQINYKKRSLKVKENHNFKWFSLFGNRVKDTDELLEYLQSKDYLSHGIIEQCAAMGVFSREGVSQEEILAKAGFKPLFIKLLGLISF